MSYTNLLVSSNSDSDINEGNGTPGKCEENSEAIEKVNRSAKKQTDLLASFRDDDEGDDDVFVDVENTDSWSKNIDAQNISYCGLAEPADSLSDLTTKSEGDVSVENNLELNSNNSATDLWANDLSSVRSDDEKEGEEFLLNNSETGDLDQNLTRVEISIVNDSGVSNAMSVKTRGSSSDDNASIEIEAGAAFELQSNNSGTGSSVQTDISIATRSDETLNVGNEQDVGLELQSNGSDTGVSLNNLSSVRSDENASIQSDPDIEPSLKSDDSKASLTVNVPRSIRSEDSVCADNSSDQGVDLLLEECKASVAMDGRQGDMLEEKTSLDAESEFDVEECKGSISLILKTREGIGKTTCEGDDTDGPIFQHDVSSDATNDASVINTPENIVEKLDSVSGNASDCKTDINENSSYTDREVIDESLESESEAEGVHLRTEEFKRDEATNHPQNAARKVDRNIENVQFTWDFNTSTAIKDLSVEKTGANIDGKADPEMNNNGKPNGQDNDPSSDDEKNVEGNVESDPEPGADVASPENNAPERHNSLEFADSPTQLTTKSLDILSPDSENQDIPEELHNSKSFGIPNKKSSKNRSACSLVKHNNSVEIIRTKNDDDDTETDGDVDENDEDDGIGYGFAHKSSSSLGKHRDSVELLCGKRFDSGSSMQVQKMSFLNNAVDDDQDEIGGAYQSRSGLLKIRDSVEIIGMGDEDMDIGDVTFESSSHHSPRSILKINKPRSKENAISNSRLVSWKDTTAETELENNFPDDTKQTEMEFSVDGKRVENLSADEIAAEKSEESATLPTVAKKKPAKKPPRPKVGNLIKLFSSSKKIEFDETGSDSSTPLSDRSVIENVQRDAQNEGSISNEGDSEEIKKTFNFWKKVCEYPTAEEKCNESLKEPENEKKSNSDQDNLNIKIIEKVGTVDADSIGSESDAKRSVDSVTVPKKPHKFVEKFEGTTMVPNPLFKNFPLPLKNVFVKDRVSVLERSSNTEQEGGSVKSAEEKPVKNP